jgi:hypothetical protein
VSGPGVHDELPARPPRRPRAANPAVAAAKANPSKWVEYTTTQTKQAQVAASQLRNGKLQSVDPLHFDVEYRNNHDGTATVYVRYHELARSPEVIGLDDQALWIRVMENERKLAEGDPDEAEAERRLLDDEAERRFGRAALERVAARALETHASPDDLVRWAREGWPSLQALLEHDDEEGS